MKVFTGRTAMWRLRIGGGSQFRKSFTTSLTPRTSVTRLTNSSRQILPKCSTANRFAPFVSQARISFPTLFNPCLRGFRSYATAPASLLTKPSNYIDVIDLETLYSDNENFVTGDLSHPAFDDTADEEKQELETTSEDEHYDIDLDQDNKREKLETALPPLWHLSKTETTLIKATQSGRSKLIWNLINTALNTKTPLSPPVFSYALEKLSFLDPHNAAQIVKRLLDDPTQQYDLDLLNLMLRISSKVTVKDAFSRILKIMKSQGIEPNFETFVTVLLAEAVFSNYDRIASTIEEMRLRGIRLTSGLYKKLIVTYCSNSLIDEAWKLLQGMTLDGMTPGEEHYCAILQGALQLSGIEEAQQLANKVVQELEKANIRKTIRTYNALVMLHSHYGGPEMEEIHEKLLAEMRDNGIEPNCYTVLELAYGLSRLQPPNYEEKLQNLANKYNYISGLHKGIGSIFFRFQKLNDSQGLITFYKFTKMVNVRIKMSAYHAMFQVFEKRSDLTSMEELLHSIEEIGMVPFPLMYATMATSYLRIGDADNASKWLAKLEEKGCQLDAKMYMKLITAVSKGPHYDLARNQILSIIQSMKNDGIEVVNDTFYAILMNFELRYNKPLRALAWMEEMREKTISLVSNQMSNNAFVVCLRTVAAARGSIEEPIKMLADYKRSGGIVRYEHFEAIARGLATSSPHLVPKLFSDIVPQFDVKLKDNHWIHVWINAYAAAGDVENTIKSIVQCIREEIIIPAPDDTHIFTNHLNKVISYRRRRHGLPPPTPQYLESWGIDLSPNSNMLIVFYQYLIVLAMQQERPTLRDALLFAKKRNISIPPHINEVLQRFHPLADRPKHVAR